jgi:hypothetical protein
MTKGEEIERYLGVYVCLWKVIGGKKYNEKETRQDTK